MPRINQGAGEGIGISVPNSFLKGRELSRGGKLTPGGLSVVKNDKRGMTQYLTKKEFFNAQKKGERVPTGATNWNYGTKSVVTGKGAKTGLKEGAGIGQKGGVVKTKDWNVSKAAQRSQQKWVGEGFGFGKGYSGKAPTMTYGRAMRLAKAKKAGRETKRGKNK